MDQILFVDTDSSFASALEVALSPVPVLKANNRNEAIRLTHEQPISLVLLNCDLPQEEVKALQEYFSTLTPPPPLIFISEIASNEKLLGAINTGISGFFEKPVCLESLKKRIVTLTNGGTKPAESSRIRLCQKSASAAIDGTHVQLTSIEFRLLSLLIAHQGRWVSRQQMERYIWGKNASSRNNLDTHLSNLRKKLPILKDKLKALRGRGFLFQDTGADT